MEEIAESIISDIENDEEYQSVPLNEKRVSKRQSAIGIGGFAGGPNSNILNSALSKDLASYSHSSLNMINNIIPNNQTNNRNKNEQVQKSKKSFL